MKIKLDLIAEEWVDQENFLLEKELIINIPLAIHKLNSKIIIINYPGANGHIDGYDNKYLKLGDYLVTEGLGAVVRIDNYRVPALNYQRFLKEKLEAVIRHVIENSENICGHANPDIYLMGFSDGAAGVAAVAHKFEQVKKILLGAPSFAISPSELTDTLEKYKGEVAIIIGENDQVVGVKNGQQFYDLASGTQNRKVFIVPNCDHQFRGEINGKILSRAPFWAFADETLVGEDGIKLYD